MTTRILIVVALCVWPDISLAAAPATRFQFLQMPGPYPVGLKVVDLYDRSRTYGVSAGRSSKFSTSGNSRPLQTLIWYPAVKSKRKPMTIDDYTRLADTEIHFDAPRTNQNRWHRLLDTSLTIRLRAVQDAIPADGHFPVLIYAPSDSSVAWENADLCEYLASYGYIALASPSMGASARDMTDDLAGIEAQASDISFIITYAKLLPRSDISQVAVVSWSWGGMSSLFAAARDPRINALVSLDGSFRYYPGLVQSAGVVLPERLTIPLLFFTRNVSLEDLASDDIPSVDKIGPNVLNAWKGDLLKVNMLGMAHPEFSSMFQRRESAQRFAQNQVADYGRKDANTSYALVALYTLQFLNAYLKQEAPAKAFLTRSPAENGAPKHFMDVKFRAANKPS